MSSILPGHRVAVIGDVGGHRLELVRELRRLGADGQTGRLPPDLTVVQVGDLVHRGPDSPGVVRLVDAYLRRQPEQWVQLVGNHEAHYLRPRVFEWPEELPEESVRTLKRWWSTGLLRPAAAVHTPEETFLVTHAGLTYGYWSQVLGSPADADRAAALLNAQTGENVLFRAGQMLGGGPPDPLAGPLWAHSANELIPGWLGPTLPFSQIHGHCSLAGRLSYLPTEVVRGTEVDRAAGHEVTTLPGGRIVGVDPGHGRAAHVSWRPWVIEIPPPA